MEIYYVSMIINFRVAIFMAAGSIIDFSHFNE